MEKNLSGASRHARGCHNRDLTQSLERAYDPFANGCREDRSQCMAILRPPARDTLYQDRRVCSKVPLAKFGKAGVCDYDGALFNPVEVPEAVGQRIPVEPEVVRQLQLKRQSSEESIHADDALRKEHDELIGTCRDRPIDKFENCRVAQISRSV